MRRLPEPRTWMSRIARFFKGTGAGTEDVDIVGDAGPTDVAPGSDPDRRRGSDPLESPPR